MSSKSGRNNLSIKKNFLYNSINTVSGILFPLITFPYAARILLADGIGQINFFSSIINYIILFTSLGIPLYAVREIAKVRNNEKMLSKVAVEILILHIVLTFFGYLIVILIAASVAKVQADIPLFLLLSTSILLTSIGAEWFYKGIEDFQYITIRNLVVRSVCLVLLFFLVKTRDDIMWYAAYTVFGVLGGYVFNFVRLRKFIHLRDFDWRKISPLSHLKPALHIFVLNLITSIYVYLNTIMLGFIANNAAVGYYVGATKITQIVLSVITSLGVVMLPRLSNLIADGQKDEFDRLAAKSINFTVAISFPLTIALIVLAPSLIRLFCGVSYEPAILALQIIAPVVLFIAISNVIGIQILYPQGQENKVIISTLVGAVVNLLLNATLIPSLAQNGAALASVVAEFSVTLTQIIIGASFIPVKFFTKSHLNYLLAALIMGVGIYGIKLLDLPDKINILVTPVAGVTIYFTYLFLKKDVFCWEIITFIQNKTGKNFLKKQ